jgi:hypothetical protein
MIKIKRFIDFKELTHALDVSRRIIATPNQEDKGRSQLNVKPLRLLHT